VIGGFVYRGAALPAFAGRYVYGDWSTSFTAPRGSLFVASETAEGWSAEPLAVRDRENGLGEYLLSLGTDAAGELYALTTSSAGPAGDSGRVSRLAPP
jgi:hypothetical protein